MIPEIQKVNYINCNFSVGILYLASSDESSKDNLVHQKEKA